MVQKIVLSARANQTFEEAVTYLKHNFSEAEVRKFTDRIEHKLQVVKSNPRLGTRVNKKPNVYRTVINKRILLIYQYKPLKNEIVLLAFWNTLQNPKKLSI